jgi:2-oxoglutarate dehydrogenase E1 component
LKKVLIQRTSVTRLDFPGVPAPQNKESMLDNDVWSEFHGPNAGYILALYDRYRQDPGSVDIATRELFERWTPEIFDGDGTVTLAEPSVVKIMGATNLAGAIREYGHLASQL